MEREQVNAVVGCVPERTIGHEADHRGRRTVARQDIAADVVPVRVAQNQGAITAGPGDDVVVHERVVHPEKCDAGVPYVNLIVVNSVSELARVLGVERDDAEIESSVVFTDDAVADVHRPVAGDRDSRRGYGRDVRRWRRAGPGAGWQDAVPSAVESRER